MFMGEYADSLPKKLTDAPCESDRLTIDEAHEIYSFPRTRIPLKGSLGRVIDDVVARIQQFQPWVHPFDGWCVRDTTNAGSRMWVLRNLDTKEYIRHTDIDHDNDSEYREFYDVGHKFALRTSWGDIGHPVASGAWAGDRFDIVPEDDLEIVVGEDGQVTKVNGWEDVTDEVSKEIDSLVDLL
ncbi:hypothetical protein E1B28_000533 [Marasmius oreades]|uniref:Uncharacterized protein n=1 Tax=Marasmius oreades TaxID=181124 RepID=A0A9P8AEP8_9AGAR|nr:uncharacterized protein E1B28_000533 [Marasmius oreades]KAG7098610.1 hypothetical protein E1B28_000533 [Marasmius oreades]